VLVAAAALALGGCRSGGPPATPAAAGPVTLVEGTPKTATVQLPDASQRVLDGAALDTVLAPAEPLAAWKTITDAGDRYGLDVPSYVVAFDGPSGRVVIALGGPTFDGEGSYARRCGDDRIHLVTRTLVGAVARIAAEGRPAAGPRLGC
jgi:hypothetical protein